MSHETFPSPPVNRIPEDTRTDRTRPVSTDEADEDHQITRWFREAKAAGYDFIFHQAQPVEATERKLMLVAKGVDSSRIIRVLVGEENVPNL